MTAIGMDATRRLDLAQVIRRAFGVIGKQLPSFAIVGGVAVALPQALLGLGQGGMAGEGFNWTSGLLMLVGWIGAVIGACVVQAMVVQATVADLGGRTTSLADGVRFGLRLVLPLFALSMVTSVGLGIGFLLLLVPGLILMTLWAVAAPVLIIEQKGVFASLQRSRDLTRNHRWPIFGLIVVVILAYFLIFAVIGLIVALTGGGSVVEPTSTFGAIGSGIGSAIGSVVAAAGLASIYYELRSIKEGASPQELASVFD